MKLHPLGQIVVLILHFSTLDSGLRDETHSSGQDISFCTSHFSTLDSGLRDETSKLRVIGVNTAAISVPSTRVYAMKP